MRHFALIRFPSAVGLAACLLLAACATSRTKVSEEPPGSHVDEGQEVTEQRHRLKNGLQVVIRRDTRSSLAAVVTRVNAGYLNEDENEAGISHLLEHMILQGTQSHPGDEQLAAEFRALGARVNAATTYDHTESWMVLPAAEVEAGISLAAEIYREPLLDESYMSREKLRVRQEILRKLEDPEAFARDALLQLIYSRHRMGRGSEESMDQLDAITHEQLVRFHQDHYRPANTTVTVVGDVDTDAVLAAIEAAYGGVERGELRLHRGPDESEPNSLRYTAIPGEYDPNLVMVGFPLPGEGHRDLPALELLATVLVEAQSSRLRLPYQRRSDRVFGLNSRLVRYEGAGLLEISIQASSKKEDQALRGLFVEIERVRRFGAQETELAGARRLLTNRWWSARQDVLSQARELASKAEPSEGSALSGPDNWSQVRSEDLQEVAERWLTIPRASVVQLLDAGLLQARPFYARLDAPAMQAHLEGAVFAAIPRMTPVVLPPPPPTTHSRLELAGWARAFDSANAGSKQRLHRTQFDNGTSLIVQEDASLPSVYVSIWFRGGRIAEVSNSAGSTAMIQKMMLRQTLNRTPPSMARELDGLGTRIDALRELDGFGFGAEVYRAELPYAFDILYDLVANPRFGPFETEQAREQQYREIKAFDRQLYSRSAQLLREAAWGTHGYALPEYGKAEVVKIARSDRLEELQIESCDPSNAVIVVTGAVDVELVAEFLELYIQRWTDLSDLFPDGAEEFFESEFIDPLPSFEDGAEVEIHRSSPLAALQLGFAAPGPRDPQYVGTQVFAAWLGGGSGALWKDLESKGAARRLALSQQGGALGSLLCAYLVTGADELEEAEAALLQSMYSVAENPPNDEEAARAARYVAVDHRIRHQSLSARAKELARREIVGLAPESAEKNASALESVSATELGALLQSIVIEGTHAVGRVQGARQEPHE